MPNYETTCHDSQTLLGYEFGYDPIGFGYDPNDFGLWPKFVIISMHRPVCAPASMGQLSKLFGWKLSSLMTSLRFTFWMLTSFYSAHHDVPSKMMSASKKWFHQFLTVTPKWKKSLKTIKGNIRKANCL